jgi:hypothetical protein
LGAGQQHDNPTSGKDRAMQIYVQCHVCAAGNQARRGTWDAVVTTVKEATDFARDHQHKGQ